VRYAVDVDYFAAQLAHWRPQRQALRQQLGLPRDGRVLLWCGKVSAVKHPGLLLEALERLPAAERLPLWLVVVGDGELREGFERGAESLLPGRCRFLGFLNQSQLGRAYALADALVFPSRQGETWGLVVNEAMACGLPAVVSDLVGCHEDLIREGESGLVYPCGDAAALAACLARMARDPEASRRMGEAGRKLVERAFTVEAAAAGIRAGLQRVIGRSLGPGAS
jgi:glycosyltransferase involved in cell wall biosynthesis